MENTQGCRYIVKEIVSKVWLIEDKDINVNINLYLIEGRDKALLIDTGWGIGNLYEVVTKLTSLPIMLINTHGHIDHIGGNHQFDQNYIHEDDVRMMRKNCCRETRLALVERISGRPIPEGFSVEAWVNVQEKETISFKDEFTFDLGDRIIEVILTPGHTYGSICLFDRKEGFLFTGDTVNQGITFVNFKECAPLHTFYNSLQKLAKNLERINYIMPSHGKPFVSKEVILELLSGTEKILSGEIKGVPHSTFIGDGLLCKFESCGILYREENL